MVMNITDADTHTGGRKKAVSARTAVYLINREEITEITVKCSLDDNDQN